MRRGRHSIAVAAAVLLGLVFTEGAMACSCVRSTPAEALAGSEAAVVGRLLRVVEPPAAEPLGASTARFDYRILHAYRGPAKLKRGVTLSLKSPLSGAACGLPQGVGRHYGLLLFRGDGRWSSSACGVMAPRDMRLAAKELESSATHRSQGSGQDCAG